MDYQALYRQKLTTPEEAVACVRDGDWIEFGYATGTPVALDRALARRMPPASRYQPAGQHPALGTGDFPHPQSGGPSHLEQLPYDRD